MLVYGPYNYTRVLDLVVNMAVTGLYILKLSTLLTLSIAEDISESYEKYLSKYPNIRWYSTKHDDYYDLLETPGPTPPPDPYAAKYFVNSTEKFMGEIIFREFLPMKLTIKRNTRLQEVLRPNFEGAEAFSVFIVSEKFIGVEDWKVVSTFGGKVFIFWYLQGKNVDTSHIT